MNLRRFFALKDINMSTLLMPGRWTLKSRILVSSAAFLILGIAALGFFVSRTLEDTFRRSVDDRLFLVEESVKNDLDKDRENLLSLVSSVAAIPEVVQFLADEDRNGLMGYVLPYVDRVRNSTGRHSLFLHFHNRVGASFLRTWNVDQWQDDIAKTRSMVARANREFTSLAGIDRGYKGLSLRAIIPVMKGVEHVGSVEAGITLEEVFESLFLPPHYGAAMVLREVNVVGPEESSSLSAEKISPLIKVAGNVDMATAQSVAGDERTFGSYGTLSFRRLPLNDFQGQTVGGLYLFFDDYQLLQARVAKVNNFIWLAIVGSVTMWCFLYLYIMKFKTFVEQLKKVILSAQGSNFTTRFKTDHVHCREILECDNESCPVHGKPYLFCHLEVGSESLFPDSYKACRFLDEFKTCSACPVYKANQRDELTEAKWLMNTQLRVLDLFLVKSSRLFSEVFGGWSAAAQTLSLEDVSKHLDQMAHIAKFSRDLRGVLDKAEFYRILSAIFEKHFHLEKYVLMEVSNSENRMEVVAGGMECHSVDGGDVRMDCSLCRANRVGEPVCSYNNERLCSYFNCDSSKEFRTCLPMVMGGRVGAVFSFCAPMEEGVHWRAQVFVLRRYLDVAAPVLSSMRLLQVTKDQTLYDPLTHCHNRRFLDEYIRQYEVLSQRHQRKVGFLMADLDYFKQVNDQYGHQIGDYVLREIARVIKSIIRRSDVLVRYGGEEFLVLLPEITPGTAMEVAEKIRVAVEGRRFDMPGAENVQKTISIGVSEYPQDADKFYKAIKYADVALYEAKKAGRNRIVCFKPGMWDGDEY